MRSSEDLLDPGSVAPLSERVIVCGPVPRMVSADGRRVNDEGGVLLEGESAGRLILRAGTTSSLGRMRDMDLVRGPLIDDEPPCEGLNARDWVSMCS